MARRGTGRDDEEEEGKFCSIPALRLERLPISRMQLHFPLRPKSPNSNHTMPYNTIQVNATAHYDLQYHSIQSNTKQRNATECLTMQYQTMQNAHHVGLHCIVFCCIGLHRLLLLRNCLLYTSPSPRDRQKSRMPSSA